MKGYDMTFEEFEKEYKRNFKELKKYTPDQVGSYIYLEKLAELSDINPVWADTVEEQVDKNF